MIPDTDSGKSLMDMSFSNDIQVRICSEAVAINTTVQHGDTSYFKTEATSMPVAKISLAFWRGCMSGSRRLDWGGEQGVD